MNPAEVARFVAATPRYAAIVPGIRPWDTDKSLQAAAFPPGVRFGAALHPWEVLSAEEAGVGWRSHCAAVEALLADGRVAAIGETGLDRVKADSNEARSHLEDAFLWHIELAVQSGLPLIVHCVRDHGRCIELLSPYRGRVRGVIHAYTRGPQPAEAYGRIGFLVGIGGAVTRPHARRVRAAAAELPIGQLLLETDAPYIAPHRDSLGAVSAGPGTAADIHRVLDEVAELRGMETAELADAVAQNFFNLFGAVPAGFL